MAMPQISIVVGVETLLRGGGGGGDVKHEVSVSLLPKMQTLESLALTFKGS